MKIDTNGRIVRTALYVLGGLMTAAYLYRLWGAVSRGQWDIVRYALYGLGGMLAVAAGVALIGWLWQKSPVVTVTVFAMVGFFAAIAVAGWMFRDVSWRGGWEDNWYVLPVILYLPALGAAWRFIVKRPRKP